jgi:hypothetical protein
VTTQLVSSIWRKKKAMTTLENECGERAVRVYTSF